MAQMKEQDKTPGKELNKIETSNLLDTEFKTLIIRTLKKQGPDHCSSIGGASSLKTKGCWFDSQGRACA